MTKDVAEIVSLLAEARPYVESFAQLTKHPTADKAAMALAKRMRRTVQTMQGKETKTVDHVGETPDRLNGTGSPASPVEPKCEHRNTSPGADYNEWCNDCGGMLPSAQNRNGDV